MTQWSKVPVVKKVVKSFCVSKSLTWNEFYLQYNSHVLSAVPVALLSGDSPSPWTASTERVNSDA